MVSTWHRCTWEKKITCTHLHRLNENERRSRKKMENRKKNIQTTTRVVHCEQFYKYIMLMLVSNTHHNTACPLRFESSFTNSQSVCACAHGLYLSMACDMNLRNFMQNKTSAWRPSVVYFRAACIPCTIRHSNILANDMQTSIPTGDRCAIY